MNKKVIKMPSPEDRRGFTNTEMIKLCHDNQIVVKEFFESLDTNTCAVDKETNTTYTYSCDVNNALHKVTNGECLFFD